MATTLESINAIGEQIRKAEALLRESLWQTEELRIALQRLQLQKDMLFLATGEGRDSVRRF